MLAPDNMQGALLLVSLVLRRDIWTLRCAKWMCFLAWSLANRSFLPSINWSLLEIVCDVSLVCKASDEGYM